MKKLILLSLFCALAQIFSVTVDGYAFLQNETDYTGIKVILQKVAPDMNFRDTLYTNAIGYYYSDSVDFGLYEAFFSSSGFRPDTININAYSDITVDTILLTSAGASLFGSISGTISAGEYVVTENLTIDQGDSLIIQPNVTLLFNPGLTFNIFGYLKAEGNINNRITFTSATTEWSGIHFYDAASDNSTLDCCTIEKSNYRGIYADNCNLNIRNSIFMSNIVPSIYTMFGGSIYADNSIILVENCEFIDNNSATIYFFESELSLINCIFNNNIDNACIFPNNSTFIMDSCLLENNHSEDALLYVNNSVVTIDNSIISGNVGYERSDVSGALRFYNSDVLIKNSNIERNWCGNSGGIYGLASNIQISNCNISDNHGNDAGGISLNNSNSLIESSTISYNSPNGVGIYINTSTEVINSVISNNSQSGIYTSQPISVYNSIIHQNNGNGIHSSTTITTHNISNNCFYLNSGSDFYQCYEYLGVTATTNSNGDPCDPWYNISIDPKFVNATNKNFRLQSYSPCIDAGINTIDGYEFSNGDLDDNYRIWDGDGNGSQIVDMGAYEYGATSEIENGELMIVNYSLSQNYPNPFNPETTLSYSLMNNAQVNLKVFDVSGREISSLVDQKQNKGLHEVKFDGSMLTSGIYFYRLSINGIAVENRKMMLLK